jgi:hypothetical protein
LAGPNGCLISGVDCICKNFPLFFKILPLYSKIPNFKNFQKITQNYPTPPPKEVHPKLLNASAHESFFAPQKLASDTLINTNNQILFGRKRKKKPQATKTFCFLKKGIFGRSIFMMI